MVLAHNINEGDRTQDIRISQDVTFETMLLTSRTMKGLKDSGFYKPSPIQLHGIPLGKCGFDLLLEAKSGTGKTAVFSIIALEKIDINKGLQVVILAPTREIAMQICDVIKQIGARHKGLCVEVVMGGLPVIDDVNKFKNNVHIVVGSPGRLKHLIQSKYIDTAAVRLLILDEADKLMEKSFQSDINFINLKLPKQKQIIMSSATYPEGCKSLISSYVQNAQHICPDSNNFLLGIEQKITVVKYNSNIIRQTQHRFTELLKILTNKQFKQCLIFCNYQARVSELYKMLTKEKWPVEQLYGQQDQTDRLDALKTLQEYKCRLLISTDLAARGIDASNVDLVVNFEPPFDWQTYLHRIGRAGRFGSYGLAVTILSEGREQNEFKILLESIKLPFNLTDLWSNAEFCMNNNNVSKSCFSPRYECYELNNESMSTFHKNNMDLWNALTSNFNLVEGFHKISETSIETKAHDKLESFHDLLESFKDNNANCTSSKMPPKDVNDEHFPKDLTLQSTKFAETGDCNSIFIVKQMQNDKKTEVLNETNVKFSKTGLQHSKLNLHKGENYQMLDTENSMNANCTYSPSFPIDPKELSNEDLGLQTTKLTETDNCDSKVIIKEIQNGYKTEDIYKINDNCSKTKLEYNKMHFDNTGKYQVLDMENSIKFLNCARDQNVLKNNSNVKKDVNIIESESEICKNDTNIEDDDDVPKNVVNTESEMCQTLAKLDLPTAFSSSRYMKSHNNCNEFSKQGHFKTKKSDDQINPPNSKERHLKGNIIKSCTRSDKYNYKLDKFHHKNNPVRHDHANNGEDIPDKSKNRSKGSQYYRSYHCNLPKDQQSVEKRNQTYMQWYSSLKLHVKQVEILMYFNEIRKIDL